MGSGDKSKRGEDDATGGREEDALPQVMIQRGEGKMERIKGRRRRERDDEIMMGDEGRIEKRGKEGGGGEGRIHKRAGYDEDTEKEGNAL